MEVGAYEAKTHFSRLLERVARGESITITRHGKPVAKLVPADAVRKRPVKEVVDEMLEARKGRRLGGLTIKDMIREGRI
jgi:prevent-host-death family protein